MKFLPVETDHEIATGEIERTMLALFRELDRAEQYKWIHYLAVYTWPVHALGQKRET